MSDETPGRHANPERALAELAERFCQELLAGGAPDIERYARENPELAAEIRDLFPALQLLERAGGQHPSDSAEKRRTGDGPLTNPQIALEAREGAGASFVSSLLERLATRVGAFGRYEPRGEVGRGGQAVVLEVWDGDLRRNLAMKVAQAPAEADGTERPSDPRSLGRFLGEAQVTAQLDHPGIVPVHELGLDAEGGVYFTMKLVKGRDLRRIFEQVQSEEEGWTQTRALNVLQKICEAMSYAHSKGVIHRDLKPSNVMVGRFGEVYVMDWGLARVLGTEDKKDLRIRPELTSAIHSLRRDSSDDLDSPLVTLDGDVVGTPAYMSPEQARGELEAMGPHSDVYAVGAMLYQLLTGRMPYVTSGSRLSNRAVWELVQKGPPEPVHALATDVPPELEAICERAMARDVTARYAEMSGLAEDLRAYLEHRVVSAYETGAFAELRKWMGRNRGLAAAIVAGVVLAIGGLAGVGYVQAEGKKVADAERANVLRLSAFQELEDLEREAGELWPPEPEHVKAYDEWLRRARALVAGLKSNADGSSGGHRAQLAELEARALPYPDAEREEDRRSHPRAAEYEDLKLKLGAFRKAQDVRDGKAQVEEVGLEETLLRADAWSLNSQAVWLILPTRTVFGQEPRGLALARRATALESSNVYERANNLDTLAWALFANGLDEAAMATSEEALAVAPDSAKVEFRTSLERLREDLEVARRNTVIPALERELAYLEVELSRRHTWRFEDNEDRWWHAQLRKLIDAIEALADAETGLIEGLSPAHGWGVERRRTLAEALEEQTLSGPEASRRWAEAIASIGAPDAPYHGLVIEPQFGLVPIGRDPDSGLWEFALPLTGGIPERGQDGRLALREESGIVLVLLPGGRFLMGAQSSDPAAPNYFEGATSAESPVHPVELGPFFLSKYELTQGQWLRFTGRNPSLSQPPNVLAPSLLHPVEQVSWSECLEFCTRAGLALPSEAQWEYAARGGTTSAWWTGDERESLVGAANFADRAAERAKNQWDAIRDWPELDDGYVMHAPVDRLRANPFGLHHVVGNVWEWCLDHWQYSFYFHSPAAEPVAPRAGSRARVHRGSSYADSAPRGRSSFRHSSTPETAALELGLRPARAITGEVRYAIESGVRK